MDNNEQIDGLLKSYPEQVQDMASSLRHFIPEQIWGIQEIPDVPAKIIGYGFGSKYADTICTIILSKKGIKLGFYKGSQLPDPTGLLTGTGKVHKYIALQTPEDIADPAVAELLQHAYEAYKERKGV